MPFLLDEIEKEFVIQEKNKIEEKIKVISEVLKDAILQVDNKGRINFCNHSAESLFGYPNKKLIGKKIFSLIFREQSSNFKIKFSNFIKTGQSHIIEDLNDLYIKRNNDIKIPVEVSINSIKLDKKVRAIAIIRDISKRKEHERTLNENLKFQKLIASISSRFLGNVNIYNTIISTFQIIGNEVEVSRVFLFLYDDFKKALNNPYEWCAKGIESLLEKFRGFSIDNTPWVSHKLMSGERVIVNSIQDLSTEAINYKNLLISHEIKSVIIFPLYVAGSIEGFIGFDDEKNQRVWNQDEETLLQITSQIIGFVLERKNHLDELKKSEEKYRNILGSIKEGYFETDVMGNFTFFNDALCDLTGYSREELRNLNYSELCDEETNRYLVNEIIKLIENKENFKILEYVQINKDKSEVNLESSVYLMYNSENEVNGIKGMVRDVTERKKSEALRKQFNQKLEEEVRIRTIELEEALRKQKLYLDQILKASQFKTEFLATMSHELRTPLNAIIGFADLLLEGLYGSLNVDQVDFIRDIKNSAEHQFEMISNILDISKIESGNLSLNREQIDLHSIVEQVISILRPLLNSKSLSIQIKGLKNHRTILADRIKLKQIFYNLISNAVKFTEKGKITFEFIEDKEFWNFNVIDTGIGIKESDYDLIFKDFKRVESDYVRSKQGAGLGLSLTKRIVELHGGTISFESSFGKGSCFSFSIPKNVDLYNNLHNLNQFLLSL